jgi:hypothetical protein
VVCKCRSVYSRDTLNDHEGNVGIGGNPAIDSFLMVLRQAAQNNVSLFPSHSTGQASLDCTSNQLSKISRHNPQSQILSTSA